MLPVIALIGRPNVGKSTLFNRLTHTRAALVADYPGLTRDRQYGIGRLGPCPYIVVDTGGLSGADSGVELLAERQVRLAIQEADQLLFLVDARDGCMSGDFAIADELRRTGKPLTLVVNKVDGHDPHLITADFHRLGIGEPHPIAANDGRGVQQLLTTLCAAWTNDATAITPPPVEDGIRIAVVGRPNVGKSTLINRLLGEERVIAADTPGTTRDSVFIPFTVNERQYTLIDTAGVRRRGKVIDLVEKFSIIKTLQAIDACHVALLVLDAAAGISEQDATLAAQLVESGRALVIAVNKWDGLLPDRRVHIKNEMTRKLAFLDFAEQHRISALHGSGVGLLLEAVDRAYYHAMRDLPTPLLTRLLAETVQEHPPPLVHGHRIKLRYAHQGGRNPPLIIIHGNQTEAVPDAYRRYLINRLRARLDISGTPLRVEFKSGTNPFAGRRNTLTPRQLHQRERLRRFVRRQEK